MISALKVYYWCPKVICLILAIIIFVIISFVHKAPYLWLSLTLFFVLCLTTYACKRQSPILYLGSSRQTQEEAPAEPQTPIFVTDIPPTYSFVLEHPPTPPPSYGSAVLMVPGNGNKSKSENGSPKMLRQIFDRSLFRSVSRQLSVEIGNYNLETGQVPGQSSQLADNSSENASRNNSPILKRLMSKNMLRSHSCELYPSKPKPKRQVSLEVGSYHSPGTNTTGDIGAEQTDVLITVQPPTPNAERRNTSDPQ